MDINDMIGLVPLKEIDYCDFFAEFDIKKRIDFVILRIMKKNKKSVTIKNEKQITYYAKALKNNDNFFFHDEESRTKKFININNKNMCINLELRTFIDDIYVLYKICFEHSIVRGWINLKENKSDEMDQILKFKNSKFLKDIVFLDNAQNIDYIKENISICQDRDSIDSFINFCEDLKLLDEKSLKELRFMYL